MTDTLRLLYVGPDGGDADHGPDPDSVSITSVATVADALSELATGTYEGVVCDHRDAEIGLDALTSIRERRPGIPVVLCTPEPDGVVAARATRLDVTEYVPRSEADPFDRLADIVARRATDHGDTEWTLRASNEVLQELTQLSTEDGLSERETVDRVLEIGLRRLGLSFGYLSRIEDGTHEVVTAVGDHPDVEAGLETPLEATYCQAVMETGESHAIANAAAEGWAETDAYRRSGVACYVGSPISVDGEPYGTLCFAEAEPRRTPFSDIELSFLELLAEWVSRELERRHRQTELERYEDIIEAVDDGVYALDSEGYFEFVNQAMTDLTGYDEADLLGSHTSYIKNDEVVERAERIVREMIFEDRDDEETFELVVQEASGEPFPAEDHMTLLYDDEERFDGTAGVIRDITARKERDEALSALLDTTRSLMQARTPEAVAETVREAAQSDLGFDLCLVRLYDEETDTLRPVAGSDGLPTRPVYDADEAFPGETFQRGETLIVDDFDRVETFEADGISGAMYVPLGEHGVLSVGSQADGSFDDSDVSVAEILASNAAAAFDRVEREKRMLRYESVVENVRDMVYVLDDDGYFQLVTEPLAEYLGFERASLVGAHPRDVLDETAIDAFEHQIRELRGSDDPSAIKLETTLETTDGVERPVEIEVSLLDDGQFQGTVGVVRDLTELKRARAELADERDRFSYLFETLPDAVVETETVDDAQFVKSVNPAFADVFGHDADAAVDRRLSDLLRPPDTGSHDDLPRFDERTTDGDPLQAEVRLMTETGFRDFLFRGIPYSRDGDRVRGFGIYTDITVQRERERRLKVLNRVLRHNLRNDLTVVLGMADALDERIEDDELLSVLDRLRGKAEEVASLSQRAREIERSVRRDQFGTGPVDVPTTARQVVDAYSEEFGGRIETALPAESVPAADGRLHRVLAELVENSIEHGGPAPTVRVAVEATDRIVTVTIADDGPGIPSEELDVVTGDEPITQLRHGSGLGLWLVIWVTETYGGTVAFDTGADGGAVVTLELPRTDV